MIDLSHLNPQQKEAVETTEGPLLVLAGAGSGKTSVLTHRIAFILDAGLAGPTNILAVTFTNKAAGEMKERVARLLEDNDSEGAQMTSLPWMGTFHSIGVKLLKIYGEHVGLDRTFSIYDSSDQLSAVKEAMDRLKIPTKDFNPRAIQNYISSAKNQLITPIDYESFAQGYFAQTVAEIYPVYQKILKENNAVDFDDLIMLSIKLLEENKKILEKFQNDFKYILVDEYQDTNHAQYRMIKLLAAVHKNICAVGDDDQSIYSFRGATIQNILNFEKDYTNCKVIKLEQNYRSTKKILEASYQVISKNRARKDKKLWTKNDDGEKIIVYTASDEEDEGRWIVKQIEQNEIDFNDVALLYRTNAQSRSLEEAFINAGIPYRIIGGVRFYERKEIKDVLAYMKLIYNPKDNKNLERIINVPRRGIGAKTVEELKMEAASKNLSPGEFCLTEGELRNSKLENFANTVKDLKKQSSEMNIVDFINYIIERSGYLEMLDDGTLENQSRIENIRELITVAAKFIDEEPLVALELFLDEVSLLEGAASKEENEDSVTLMTIHSAKGLEFKNVYVVGMEENLFPHSNTMFDDKELEEERRLAYVAITRAKERLHLTHTLNRKYFGSVHANPPSRFLTDIPEELVELIAPDVSSYSSWGSSESHTDTFNENVDLEIGDRVKHEYFGIGTVKNMDSEMIEVDFGAVYGVKELMLEYARLEKL
ncbi:UvrD-helicase domain-containing protein [Candidatus Dojkabacteria bacterium]|uniref:DNA 3'-5' helicase n=1 Tax=Candidatus Dojkabacteria bacterium TaxID=2099670 RepID=A0A955L1V3_9BACT|nr:UvrD-helicase domain-containing protein [Candidatus Dojkabacteria bacterium]